MGFAQPVSAAHTATMMTARRRHLLNACLRASSNPLMSCEASSTSSCNSSHRISRPSAPSHSQPCCSLRVAELSSNLVNSRKERDQVTLRRSVMENTSAQRQPIPESCTRNERRAASLNALHDTLVHGVQRLVVVDSGRVSSAKCASTSTSIPSICVLPEQIAFRSSSRFLGGRGPGRGDRLDWPSHRRSFA